jgi:Xaa-Pro aminopeptidase
MESAGVDALLVWKDENVRYLTGLRAQIIAGKSALLNGCLLPRDGEPILLVSGGELDRARLVMPWIEEIHGIPIMEARGLVRAAVKDTIAPLLGRLDLDTARVGLDEGGFCLFEALRELLPKAVLADGDAVMQAARLVKFPEEIAILEEASAIAEAVTEAAIDAVRPGVREVDVVGEAMRVLYRLGGELPHVVTPFVASGEHMSPPNRFASDKIIREGDLVFIDIGAMWGGYFSDIGRTVICGRPSARQQEIYSAVHAGLAAAVETLVPGKTNDDVARATREAISKRGFSDDLLSLFIGHGIGAGANEPPYIGEDFSGADTIELQEGMVVAVEPLVWVPDLRGGGGVRLEDTIAVTAGEACVLTRTAFDERLLL